jgi:cyanate permease
MHGVISAQTTESRMAEARSFYGWKLLVALSALVSVNMGIAYVGAGVVNAPMANELGLSRSTLGLGSTVFVLVVGLAAPLVARFISLIGPRRTLCFGSCLSALAALLLAVWVDEGWQYVLAYGGILGVGCAFG